MKKLIVLLLMFLSVVSIAQTLTTVSGTNLRDKNGALITGTVQFFPDRDFGLSGSLDACCQKSVERKATVTAGSFSLSIPNEATIVPANSVCWSMIARDAAGNIVQGPDGYRCIKPSTASYNFNTYTALTAPVPISPVDLLPVDCNDVGSGYVIQKVNPDGTVKCVAGGTGTGAVDSVFGQTGVVPDLSGDVTTTGSSATTLATVNTNVGSIGDSTHSLTLNIDAKGRILSATANAIAASGGTWGSITGTLSSQTDLQNALNLKANNASPTFTGTVNAAAVTASGTVTAANYATTGAGAGNTEYNGGTFQTSGQTVGSTRIGADSGGVSAVNEQALLNIPVPIQNGTVFANEGTTGTLAHGLVCVSSSLAISCPTSTTVGVLGIAIQGTGTTGSVSIRSSGEQQCTFENTSVVGNWFIPGTGTRGNCRDSGTASTSAAPTGALGVAIEAGVAGLRKIIYMGAQGGAGSTPTLDAVGNPVAAKTFTLGNNAIKFDTATTTVVPFTINGAAQFASAADIFDVNLSGTNYLNVDTNGSLNFRGILGCQGLTCLIADANAGGFEFKNGATGLKVAGIDDVSAANAAFYVNLTATSALTAGQVVKVDAANASKVIVAATTDTGGGIAIGFVTNSATTAANNARIASLGIITTPLVGTGTCAIGDFVIVDTTTAGRVKCTASYTAGTVLGKALTAQASVGSAVTVMIGLR